MTYDEIKEKISSTEKEIVSLDNQLKALHTLIDKDNEEIKSTTSSKNMTLERVKKEQLARYLEDNLGEYKDSVRIASESVRKLRTDFEISKSSIDPSSFLKDDASSKLLAQVTTTTSIIEEKIEKNLGTRLFSEIKSRLSNSDLDYSETDVRTSLSKLKLYNKQIRSRNKSKTLGKLSDRFESFFLNKAEDDSNNNNTVTYVFYLCVLLGIIFFSIVVVPLILAVTVLICYRNIRDTWLYSQALTECYIISKNFSKLENARKKKANEEYNKRLSELTDKFNKEDSKLKEALNNANDILNTKTIEFNSSFVFNPDNVERDFQHYLNIKSASLKDNTIKVNTLTKERDGLAGKLQELNNMLSDSIHLMQDEYLNPRKLGESQECITDILIDVVDNSPVFFNFPKHSCFFVYKDVKDLIDFIRLFVIQLRARMDSDAYSIDIWDSKSQGSSFLDLTAQDIELLGICATPEDIQNDLSLKSFMNLNRTGKIKRSYTNIFEYNAHLISIDSIIEPYSFIFCIDQPASLFNKDTEAALVRDTGGDSGIFVLNFISDSDMKKDSEYLDLVEMFSSSYLIERGSVIQKARNFIRKLYEPSR